MLSFWGESWAASNVAKIWSAEFATLQEAVNMANSWDVIELLQNIVSKEQYSAAPSTDVAVIVDKDITFKGNGFKLIRPNNYLASLLKVVSGSNVILESMVIDWNAPWWSQNFEGLSNMWYITVPISPWIWDIEATASTILNEGKLLVLESKLENMLASGNKASGVGIKSLKGSELLVEKSEFNHIGWRSVWGWAGISVENKVKLMIKDSIFDNNVTVIGHTYGWAVNIGWGVDDILPVIENSEFRNCHAMNGWAVFIGTASIKISNSKFINNSAGNDGSAIQINNTAASPLKNEISYITDTLFSGNVGLSTWNQSLGTVTFAAYHGKLTIFNSCEFRNNIANAWWAVADFGGAKSLLEFNDCDFIGNKATGGVFYAQNMEMTVNNSHFTKNQSISCWSVGCILNNSSLLLNDSKIYDNISHSAGALTLFAYNSTNPKLILGGGTEVYNNRTDAYAGWIYMWSYSWTTGATLTFEMQSGSKLYNNSALSWGDDFYSLGRTGNNLKIILQPAKDMATKDSDGRDITGWFKDYASKRYVQNEAKEFTGLNYDGKLKAVALKAANQTYTIRYEWDALWVSWTMSDQEVVVGVQTLLSENQFSLLWHRFSGRLEKFTDSIYWDQEVVNLTWTPASIVTLYAQWTPIVYTLTFDLDWWTGTTTLTGNYNDHLVVNNPTKTWFTFSGWNPSLPATITADQAFKAEWKANPTSSSSSSSPGGGYSGGGEMSYSSTPEQKPDTSESVKTEAINTELFNPTIKTSCFSPLDKKTIDQGNKMIELMRIAHQMLYSYQLTKWQGTRDFAPERSLTREEAARFMTEFATNVLCRKPSRIYTANFTDLEDADPTLIPYIKKSYEYLIFNGDDNADGKKEHTKFRPRDLVSVNELAAIMTRLVRNELMEEVKGDWARNYKLYLSSITPKTALVDDIRGNIAEVIYDLYRNNAYELKEVGYVIKK